MKSHLLFGYLMLAFSIAGSLQQSHAQELAPEIVEKYHDALTKFSNGSCAAFTADPSSSPVSCNGFNDGVACITVTSGIGPFNYLWLGEASTDSCLSNIDAGAYIVIVTDVGQGGASCSWQININEPAAIGVISMNATPPSCFTTCDATANPLVVGGNGGYSYDYDSGEMTQAASMLCNPFELIITDSMGCTTDTTYVFTNAPDTIKINATVTDNICFGELDGAIDLTVTGGIGTYDFTWNGPNSFTSSQEDISGLEPGVYDVLVTDDNGCVQTESFTVMEAIELTIDATKVDVVCYLDSTGSIDITPGGGSPGYTFSWTGPNGFTSGDEDIFNLIAGPYFLTMTDLSGCQKDTSFVIDQNPEILISALVTDNLCADDNTGTIDVSIVSLLGIASYSWTGPGTFTSAAEDLTDLFTGDYTLTVTDFGGCEKDTTITVGSPDSLALDIMITDILCSGDSMGSIDLEITGGTPAYLINWSGPGGFSSIDQDISDLVVGDYTVIVTDVNNCEIDSTVTISEPLPVSVEDSITDAFCASGNTGSIVIDITGGTGLYSTSWTGPGSFTSLDEDIFGLVAGTYGLTVTDENLCQFDFSFEVGEPDSILIDFNTTDLACAGDSSGQIDITVTGGIGNYDYAWMGPVPFTSTDEDISDLEAGIYTVQVSDENNCTSEASIEIFEPAPLVLDTTVTHISCADETDGAIDLEISGGSGPFDISWTGPGTFSSSSEDIDNLGPGTYMVLVTDDNACTANLSVEIIEPASMVIDGLVTDVLCNGDMTGAIDITVTMGAGGYSYSWVGTGGFTSIDEDLSGLLGGVYIVTVTDANLCSQMSTFVVDQNEEIVFAADIVQIECAGDSTGSIDVSTVGGQTPITYSWTGPNGFSSSMEDISNLTSGTYILVAEDALGCTEQQAFVISEPPALQVDAVVLDPLCFGEENGDINIFISGGTPDYLIEWVGPNGFNMSGMGIDIADLEAGSYNLTITDFFGCTLDTSFTLIEPDDLQASLIITEPGCDLPNGSVSSNVLGGTVATGYTYFWLNNLGDTIGTASDINGLEANSYTFIVQDDNDCTVTIPFELSDDVGTISALIQDVSCFGDMDGAIDVEVTGLSGVLVVDWIGPASFSANTLDISGLAAGEYTVMIEDELGCMLVETYSVESPIEIQINGNIENESCLGLQDGAIDITVIGAQGASNYSWTGPGLFTSMSQDIADLAPGSYEVTVTDAGSCTNTASFIVLPAVDYILSAAITDIDCAGDMNGAIDLSSNPGLIGASYSWTGPNGFLASSEDIAGLDPGTYMVTVTTPEFCLLTGSYDIEENDALSATINTSSSICGMSTGSASITVTGGEITTDYSYSIFSLPGGSIISSTSSATGLDGGQYGYTISDDNGCELTGTFTVSDQFGTLDAIVQDAVCAGSVDGSIDISIAGLTGNVTIAWVGPNSFSSDQEDISDLEPGFYTVTITDENDCVIGDTYEIEDGAEIIVSGTITHVSCFGQDDGAIDMEFTGGQLPYDISWSGPGGFTASQEDINALEPGIYTVTITDLNNCVGMASFTVDEPGLLDVVAFVTPVMCNGELNGAIDITILNGAGPFTVNWTGPGVFGSSFQDISGLIAGNYSLTIVDANNCVFTEDYVVGQPDPIDIALIQLVNSSCSLDQGIIEVDASGGNSPYSYTWTNSFGFEVSNVALADNLPAGTYTVLVEDEDGCSASDSFGISNQEAVLTGVVESVSCNGLSDGAIDLTVSGTITGMADTLWTGPGGFTASSEDISGLIAGDYIVTIEDQASCVFTETFTVFEPDTILITGTAESVNCNGSTDGSIDIDVSGGTGAYTYAWTGPGTFNSVDEDLTGLSPGIYDLTVTDIVPCSVDFSIEILEPTVIDITQETLIDPTCVGLDDGVISIGVTGGNGGYEFDWSGEGFTSSQEDLTNLGPGIFDLVVTDDSSCTQMASFELNVLQVISIDAAVVDLLCNGDDDATIDITATGGTGNLDYDWIGPPPFSSSDEDLAGLSGGSYGLLITDEIGCQNDTVISIAEPDTLVVDLVNLDDASCVGLMDGSIDIEVSGGIEDYTYAWIGPSFTDDSQDINGLTVGVYEVTVTDFNGCQYVDSFTVSQPDTIQVLAITEPVNCNGDADGSISITVSGGTGNYDFEWTGPAPFTSNEEDISDLPPGIYDLIVTDDMPCSADFSFEILEPSSIVITEELLVDPTCSGLDDGQISIDVVGGNGGYEFQWNGPSFNSTLEDITGLGPGQYNVSILDDSSCVGMASFTMANIQAMDIDITVDSIACNGDSDASIDITVSGSNGGFVYQWTGPAPFTSMDEDLSSLSPGDYELVVTDAIGCQLDSIISLLEPEALSIVDPIIIPVTCNGGDDGSISLDVMGGQMDYMYSWTGPGVFTANVEDIAGLGAGDYSLTITDLNDCTISDVFTVSQPSPLLVIPDALNDTECENSSDGSLFVTVSGGNSGYQYSWIGPNGYTSIDEDLNNVFPGNYVLTATDQFGCVISEGFTIDFEIEISANAGVYDPACNGEDLTLIGEGGPVGSDFSWSTPAGPDFASDLVTEVQVSPTNDIFILTVTNGNCIASDTAFIDVLPAPEPDAGDDQEVFLDDMITLGGDPTWIDAASYSWSPSQNLDDPTVANPIYDVVGEQLFTVVVIGSNGCIGSDEVLITINPSLEVPSGFTPNGDNRNETWIIQNTILFPDMQVRVFNRWGDQLWISDIGYPEEWDGKYDGNELPVGTYYFIIELNDERFPNAITGPVTIFR